jgi:hypothetical protein
VHGCQPQPLGTGIPAEDLSDVKAFAVIFHAEKKPVALFHDGNGYVAGLWVLCYVREALLDNFQVMGRQVRCRVDIANYHEAEVPPSVTSTSG